MLIGILDMLLKTRAEKVKAKKNQINKQGSVKNKNLDSLEPPAEKKGSVLLGLIVISIPVLLIASWFIGIENNFLNILGYILYLGLFILLMVIFRDH